MHLERQSASHTFYRRRRSRGKHGSAFGLLALFSPYKCADVWEVHLLLEHDDTIIECVRHVFAREPVTFIVGFDQLATMRRAKTIKSCSKSFCVAFTCDVARNRAYHLPRSDRRNQSYSQRLFKPRGIPVSWLTSEELQRLIDTYGYWAVGAIVGVESMGIPLPGETVLVIAAIYAGTHHDLNIWGVIASAATGAIMGDNVGYWLGREFGYRLLLHFGQKVGLTQGRIKLGQYLFLRHGGKVVFFGRFIAVLRTLAAFLAGVNRMGWPQFLMANAAGGIVWACVFGIGAYSFGKALLQVTGPLTTGLVILAVIIIVMGIMFMRAHEAELQAKAEHALPGPLRPVHRTLHRSRK
jgi:membrane protein DedA with SNARE-associated domain